jgi:cytidine deaminase
MEKKEYQFVFEAFEGLRDLQEGDMTLLKKAMAATKDAYAPYSRFKVGAAALLANGETITGTNQENASFPAGICAERTVLSAAAVLYPGVPVLTLAISYDNENGPSDRPISPCGICRQSLQESEQRGGQAIRLVLGGKEGPVFVIPKASYLLPLAFTAEELEHKLRK